MANQFYVQPANPNQGLQGLLGGLQQRETNQADQAKFNQQKQIMGSFYDAISSGDVAAQREIMRNNPVMVDQLKKANSLGDEQKDNLKNEIADRILNEGLSGAEAVEVFGNAAKSIGMPIDQFATMQPEQLNELMLNSYAGSEQFKRRLETQKAPELSSTQKKVKAEGIDPYSPEGKARARELHQGARTDPSLRTDQQTIDKANDAQLQAAGYANRINIANNDLSTLEGKEGFNPATLASTVAGESLAGNLILSEDQQLYKRAKSDFVTAILRRESGAAIGQDEFAREDIKYFPQINDSPAVIARKRKARETAFNNVSKQSKGVYDVQFGLPKGLPKGTTDNGDGTYTLPSGQIIRAKG